MDALPLTVSGKPTPVRCRLRSIRTTIGTAPGHRGRGDPADIYAEVLGLERVGGG